jgi:hypothetical protein
MAYHNKKGTEAISIVLQTKAVALSYNKIHVSLESNKVWINDGQKCCSTTKYSHILTGTASCQMVVLNNGRYGAMTTFAVTITSNFDLTAFT